MKKLIGIHLVAACIAAAAIAGCSKAGFSIDGPGGYYDSEKAPAAPSGDFYDIGGEGREGNMHDPFVSGVVTAAEWNDIANWSFWASLLNDLGSLDHCLHVAAVDLNAHGALFVADGELLLGGLHVANQGFSAHKLGIDHRGAKALAQQAEANVGNIFHRCQKHRVWTKFLSSWVQRYLFFFECKKGKMQKCKKGHPAPGRSI